MHAWAGNFSYTMKLFRSTLLNEHHTYTVSCGELVMFNVTINKLYCQRVHSQR